MTRGSLSGSSIDPETSMRNTRLAPVGEASPSFSVANPMTSSFVWSFQGQSLIWADTPNKSEPTGSG